MLGEIRDPNTLLGNFNSFLYSLTIAKVISNNLHFHFQDVVFAVLEVGPRKPANSSFVADVSIIDQR